MNTTVKDINVEYFSSLVKQIKNCDTHLVRYGQPLLYVNYYGMKFTDQKINCQFIRLNEYEIEVIIESIYSEYIKSFDSLASKSEFKVIWGNLDSNEYVIDKIFVLFNLFINSVINLTLLDPNDPSSLLGKKISIKNVNITKKTTYLEYLIDDNLFIMIFNPNKNKKFQIKSIFGNSNISNTIISLMNQSSL